MFSDEPWVKIAPALERPNRKRAVCAISYIGTRAMDVLKLKEGDVLYCDASSSTISQGYTDPNVLRAYMKMGVEVRHIDHLHMKVVIIGNSMWVGSMNASYSSHNSLREASLLTKDSAVIKSARKSLCDMESRLVQSEHLAKRNPQLSKYVSPVLYEGPRSEYEVSGKLHILYGDYREYSDTEKKVIELESTKVNKQKRSVQSGSIDKLDVDLIVWQGLKCKVGDWLMWTDENFAYAPGKIIHVKSDRNHQFIWIASPRKYRSTIEISDLKALFRKNGKRLDDREQRSLNDSKLMTEISKEFKSTFEKR